MFTDILYAEIWNECLDLAVAGFNHGSMGISAVITNAEGQIISRGRNDLSLNDDSINEIYGSSVAHAEINAIHALKQESLIGSDFTLFTTVEPCPMCMGAIIMSRIRNVVIGSKDPHAGSMKYINFSEYTRNKNIQCTYINGKYEKAFFALHYLSIMRVMKGRRPHIVFDNMRKEYEGSIRNIEKVMACYEIDRIQITREIINSIVNKEN